MALRVSCPYCNTGFTVPAIPPSGRVACPRCGDAFPVHSAEEDELGEVLEAAPAAPVEDARPTQTAQRKSSFRIVVPAAIIAILAIAIGAGWYYFRDSAPSGSPTSDPSTVAAAPASLQGLAFLPAESNILFALQVGPIIAYAERTNQDPRVLLTQAGIPTSAFIQLDRAGLPLQRIDQIIVGAHIPDAPDLGQLRLVMALILRSPLDDEEKFLEALAARPVPQAGKERYDIEWSGYPLKLVKASPNAWIFGWSDEDVVGVGGGAPPTRLPAQLIETLAQQLPSDAAVWLATATENWAEKRSIRKLAEYGLVRRDWLPILAKGRALAAGMSLAEEPRLRLSVRCRDADTATQLRGYFQRKVTEPGTRYGGEGDWAMFDTPVDPLQASRKLKGLLNDGE
jgi:hypothetical protein